jgi:hypothetical protein
MLSRITPPAALALLICAACGGARGGADASTPQPWRPAPGAPDVECRWDPRIESQPGTALEAACTRDPACGCATLGHALLMASRGAVDARALAVLDGACHRGVIVSCDEASLVAELCARGTARASSACDVLAQEGRLPRIEPPSVPPAIDARPPETGIERAPVTAPQPE